MMKVNIVHYVLWAFTLSGLLIQSAEADESVTMTVNCPDSTREITLNGTVLLGSDGQLVVNSPDPAVCEAVAGDASVTIESFTVNGESTGTVEVSKGQTLSLSWDSLGARACIPIGTFPGWSSLEPLGVSSSTQAGSDNASADSSYTIGLRCVNGSLVSDDVALTVSITNDAPPEQGSCGADRSLKTYDWVRRTNCVNAGPGRGANCSEWANVFGNDFAETTGLTRNITMSPNGEKEYVAMRFSLTPEQTSEDGYLRDAEQIQIGAGPRFSPMIITISQCEGDFNRQEILAETGCYYTSSVTSTRVWRGVASSAAGNCVLKANTVYYLNIIHTDSAPGTDPSELTVHPNCDSVAGCGAQWTPRL